ncbi:MAG: MBL fold metallo-hydrolase [Gemmatimonadetes bacterium]|nr:MBL fold metallo-hydrolase [Gemmatimonadota bacterium]
MRVQAVRPGIHVVSGFENGNVLVLASDTGLLLVDAQSHQRVSALDRALARLLGGRSPHRVRAVVNTHYHGDHTEGNAFFRQLGATVIAHRKAAMQAAKDTTIADWDNWHRTPLAPAAMPTQLVDDSAAFDFGGQRVVLVHAPRAHTDGDLLVWLPRANVLHIGDILEVGAPPFIDWWAGGSLRGMVATIDRLLPMVNDRTIIVPGHGAVATRAELQRYRAMLLAVEARVSASVGRGASLPQVLAERPAREWEASMGGERRAGHFVRLVYYGVAHHR